MLLSHFSVLVMVVPRNLKCSTTVTDELLMTSGGCFGTFLRKSTITSTVLLTLSSRLLTAHQDSRWPTSLREADSLLLLMRPIMVVSSAYLMVLTDGSREEQSLVYREKSRGGHRC